MTKTANTLISDEVDLCHTFIANPKLSELFSVALQEKADSIPLSAEKEVFKYCADLSLSPDELIAAQRSDSTLSPLFEFIHHEHENVGASQVYFLKDAILMRKWAPSNYPGDWSMDTVYIQTEKGMNFTCTFPQALKRLHISHNVSAAYHPESQGALEKIQHTLSEHPE